MSQVNAKTLMLGQNADQSKNFKITVPTPEDGTLTIERANGTDVMKFLAAGGVEMPSLPFLKAASGYVTLPNGFIVQWGSATTLSTGQATVTFPTPFTATPTVVATVGQTPLALFAFAQVSDIGITGFGLGSIQHDGIRVSTTGVRWIAIGY